MTAGQPLPLPIHPRPRRSETADSYLRRLAAANHLRFTYLRRYLARPQGSYGPVDPRRLAALAARELPAILLALPELAPAARPPARRYTQEDIQRSNAAKREKYAAIRRDAAIGMSERAIERKHHVGRRTIIKALASAEPPPRKKIHREPAALDGLHGHIDAMIKADPQIAIAAIWQRLADEYGATIAYPTLRTYVTSRRAGKKTPAGFASYGADLDEVTRMADFTTRTLRLPSAPVHGTLFVPVAAEPSAAVLLIGGSGGSEPSYVGQALAGEGVAALSIAYFARPRLPGQLRGIRLEYFFSALEILQNELPSSAAPIVVLGMSRGSEAAMLTAIHSPVRVRAVVATVPGNVVAGSLPPGGPAWLLDDQPLPYVDHSGPDCENAGALIPVELVPGPALLVAAGADQVWPSAAMARALSQRLHEHGDPHGHTVLEYPEATHSLGYLLPDLPTGLLPQEINDTTADKAARADAWPKAVTFIRQLGNPK